MPGADTQASPWSVAPIADDLDASVAPPTDTATDANGGDPVRRAAAKLPAGPLTRRVAVRAPRPASFVWVSAHGGAGATSLAAASGHGLALTRAWPAPELGWPDAVALVCRTHVAGLDAAGRMLAELAAGAVTDIRIVALVVVDDAPVRPTRAMRLRRHELEAVVPQVLGVPWISGWRDVPGTPHRTITTLAAAVAAVAEKEQSS